MARTGPGTAKRVGLLMKWLVAAFLLAVALAFGASALALADSWPFDQPSLTQPIHYLFGGQPIRHSKRSWRL